MDIFKLDGIYAKGYGIVPKLVMCTPALSRDAKALYAYICSYAGAGTTAFPSVATIREHLGFSKDGYYAHMEALVDEGYITITQAYDLNNGKFKHNVYELNVHPVAISDEERAEKAAKKEAKKAKRREKEAAKKVQNSPCPVGQEAVKGPCPVGQETDKNSQNSPCPVGQETVKGPCPVGQETVKGPCPVGQETVNSPCPVGQETDKNNTLSCEKVSKESVLLVGVIGESNETAQECPCPVGQDTNNNILKDLNNINTTTTTKSLENNLDEPNCQEKDLENLKKYYYKFMGTSILPANLERLYEYRGKGIGLDVIIRALDETSKIPTPTLKYTLSILDRCVEKQLYTLEVFNADQEAFRKKQQPKITAAKKGHFGTTYSHNWNLEELEKKERAYIEAIVYGQSGPNNA